MLCRKNVFCVFRAKCKNLFCCSFVRLEFFWIACNPWSRQRRNHTRFFWLSRLPLFYNACSLYFFSCVALGPPDHVFKSRASVGPRIPAVPPCKNTYDWYTIYQPKEWSPECMAPLLSPQWSWTNQLHGLPNCRQILNRYSGWPTYNPVLVYPDGNSQN